MYNSPTPEAIEIIVANEDHTFSLNEESLKSLLLDPKVKDQKVVVISIAGAFRKGKSFLLNFLLRYLRSQGKDAWMGSDDEPLLGFPWMGGTNSVTSGMLLWSEPLEIDLPSGEKVVVLLMDTQGIFDHQSTFQDWAKVFALSMLISSVQIYNVIGDIQEDYLQHLQYFAAYGQIVRNENNSDNKPFQNLTFVVRDWPNAREYNYGLEGGAEVLMKKLETNSSRICQSNSSRKKSEESQQLRTHLKSCVSSINCYLMPNPGLRVQNYDPHFNGCLSVMEEDFKTHVKAFVESLLTPEKLVSKEINGRKITGKELFQYFKVYIQAFKSDQLPEPKSVLEATAEANNLAAFGNAKDFYIQEMDEICDDNKPFLSEAQLMFQHELCKEGAIDEFKMTPKMGKTNEEDTYVWRLDQELDDLFKSYLMKNTTKFENQKKIIRGAVGGAVAGAAAGAAVAVVGIPAAAAAVMRVIRLLK